MAPLYKWILPNWYTSYSSGCLAVLSAIALGIREQDKAKIFELFYTTKAVGEGTGLGLSVTRNIINLHHGIIDIANRPQGGASVVLLFKLNEGENR